MFFSRRKTIQRRRVTLIVVLFGGAMVTWIAWPMQPLPPSENGLAWHSFGDMEQTSLTERLNKRFPIGLPEANLIREVRLEGFQITIDAAPSSLRKAYFIPTRVKNDT